MDIFKWVQDIENVYDDLIEKAKKENLEELNDFRKNQEENMEELLSKKQDVLSLAFKNLSIEVNKEIEKFDKKLEELIKNIEKEFQKNKDLIKKSILQKIGFDI
jgi:hypothetical protein